MMNHRGEVLVLAGCDLMTTNLQGQINGGGKSGNNKIKPDYSLFYLTNVSAVFSVHYCGTTECLHFMLRNV